MAPSEFTVDEVSDETVTETDEENSEIADITDKVVKAYFNRKENDDVAMSDIQTDMETNMADDLDLETISMLLMSEEGHMLSSPPMWFKIKEILQDMKVPSSVVESSEGAAKSKNEVIDNLLKNDEQVELFGSILWSQCYQIVVKESPSSSENLEISARQWYERCRMLYLLMTRSDEYLTNLKLVFGAQTLTSIQSAIGAEITQNVYKVFVKYAASFKQRDLPQAIPVDVRNMPSEGLAKVRHVSAWAIKKVLSNQRKYVRDNLATTILSTRQSVNERLEMCALIEENLIADYAKLRETTTYSETLKVTEDRQYRNRGLSHIEVLRVQNIHDNKLVEMKGNLIDEAIKTLVKSEALQEKWISCFTANVVDEKKVIINRITELKLLYDPLPAHSFKQRR